MTHMPADRALLTVSLSSVMSTSGQIYWEFLCLLDILAHWRTQRYYANLGAAEPGTDAFTWRQPQYHWQHKAAIGFATAVAIAGRAHLAHLPSPRQWAHHPAIDPTHILLQEGAVGTPRECNPSGHPDAKSKRGQMARTGRRQALVGLVG
jgi:hypothetical protein